MSDYGFTKTVDLPLGAAIDKVTAELASEGFGVLTRIDVQQTLKEKIGVEFRRYQILGACNPKFAHQALSTEIGIGVLLPCNVAVWEGDDGRTVVAAVDPMETMAAQDPRLREVATQVRERLTRVLEKLV